MSFSEDSPQQCAEGGGRGGGSDGSGGIGGGRAGGDCFGGGGDGCGGASGGGGGGGGGGVAGGGGDGEAEGGGGDGEAEGGARGARRSETRMHSTPLKTSTEKSQASQMSPGDAGGADGGAAGGAEGGGVDGDADGGGAAGEAEDGGGISEAEGGGDGIEDGGADGEDPFSDSQQICGIWGLISATVGGGGWGGGEWVHARLPAFGGDRVVRHPLHGAGGLPVRRAGSAAVLHAVDFKVVVLAACFLLHFKSLDSICRRQASDGAILVVRVVARKAGRSDTRMRAVLGE